MLVKEYAQGVSILQLSKNENYPPYMMSRYIVEHVAQLPDGKKGLTRSMRDPIGVLGESSVISAEFECSEQHRVCCKDENGYVWRGRTVGDRV